MKLRRLLTIPVLLAGCASPTSAPTDALSQDAAAADALDAVDAAGDVTATLDVAGDVPPADIEALCLRATPDPVAFDPTAVGGAAFLTVTLDNCGLSGLCLTDIELQLQTAYVGEYNLNLSGLHALCPGVNAQTGPTTTAPCCLAPDTTATMDVYFTPTSADPSKTAQIWLKWNGPQVTLPVVGTATAK